MPAPLPLRIFLATPGDLEDERAAVIAAVDEHNRRSHGSSNIVFEVVGWEQVRGTAQRPQSAINELIRESHFMVVLFKEKWGSEPGSPWGYTSGTEEELFTGLLELGLADRPMRDVWIAFLQHATPEERVMRLKEQMVRDHSMLFESTAGIRALKELLTQRLASWEAMADHKRARHIDLISSTGREVMKAARLRIAGEKLVELGQPDAGRASLKEAAAIGGPAENLAYGQLLARQGDLDAAYASAQIAIDQCLGGSSDLFDALTAEALAAQAGVLRRQGDTNAAIGRLESAITLLADNDSFSDRVRCRILDDLGIARQSRGDFDDAETAFRTALDARLANGRPHDIAQSRVNLARLAVARRDLVAARTHADEARHDLMNSAPTALHANVATLSAQIDLRLGNFADAIRLAERALALNEQFANTVGEAISHLLLAQCHRAEGDTNRAEEHAQRCLEINESIGNQSGIERAKWLLDKVRAV